MPDPDVQRVLSPVEAIPKPERLDEHGVALCLSGGATERWCSTSAPSGGERAGLAAEADAGVERLRRVDHRGVPGSELG